MAPLSFTLPLFLAAQALCSIVSTPTSTSASALTTYIPSAITPAPAYTQTICPDNLHNYVASPIKRRFFCPGVVSGLKGQDISSAYCCINALFLPEIPLTSWYYNHTGVAIPSTVIQPSCVQPIPLTASDYDAQVSAAAPAMTGPQVPMGTPGSNVEIDVDIGAVAFVTSVTGPSTATKTATYTGVRFEGAASQEHGRPIVAIVMALVVVMLGVSL
ncbi:hypothetical protein CAC42_1917 [Sphaceloma murrayae]|uniref:Uncharacterized protein n=1 Tax=Sphaceloma murrayae TaxID=2082308 RepID=A0A2K1QVV7_9PEZI|nr:hypothetical protein CAC42_1917 [Sphaceloma murrayae]